MNQSIHRETLESYLRQAESACVYELRRMPLHFASNAQVCALVRRELLEKRFDTRGLMHGARTWLNSLAAEDPAAARRVERGLHEFRPRAGARVPLALAGIALLLICALGLALFWRRARALLRVALIALAAAGAALAILECSRGLGAEAQLRREMKDLAGKLSEAL